MWVGEGRESLASVRMDDDGYGKVRVLRVDRNIIRIVVEHSGTVRQNQDNGPG